MNARKYIEANFMIDHAQSGAFVPFKFNPVQAKYYDMLVNEYGQDFFVNAAVREQIVKARKEGFTSFWLGVFATVMLYYKEARRFLEISYRIDATKQHYRRIKTFFQSAVSSDPKDWTEDLDRKVFSVATEGSELVLRHNKASIYTGTATSRTGERGGTVHGLLLTESAHYPDTGILKASEIIESSKSQVAVGSGMVVRETTSNGWNHEKKTWDQAKAGEVDYRPRFFGWREFYTPAQFETIKAGFSDKSLIPQEFPETVEESFLYSGRPAFNPDRLAAYLSKAVKPLWIGEVEDNGKATEFKENVQGCLKVWKMPRLGRHYVTSADVAEGVKGGAFSVLQVFDSATWEQVAVWRGHIDPGNFGERCVLISRHYNNASLIPEQNNHGFATIERIRAMKYKNLLSTAEIFGTDSEAPKWGFPTNGKTRGFIVSAVRNALDDFTVFLNDAVTVEELMACVIDDNGEMACQEGYFNDTVMALGIGLYCLPKLATAESYKDKFEEAQRQLIERSPESYQEWLDVKQRFKEHGKKRSVTEGLGSVGV